MSWSRDCLFFEPEPDRWYYLIDNSGRNNAWDWREEAECFGPFASETFAFDHLCRTQSNPGGYSTMPHSEYRADDALKSAVARATCPRRNSFDPLRRFGRT